MLLVILKLQPTISPISCYFNGELMIIVLDLLNDVRTLPANVCSRLTVNPSMMST